MITQAPAGTFSLSQSEDDAMAPTGQEVGELGEAQPSWVPH
jgi:hypothetical protein